MKEKPFEFKKIRNEEVVQYLPPVWCSSICRNAMNEICVEQCAIKRDCSGFEPKPDLRLSDMPHFPLTESANMTKEERFTSVTVYLAKVVDHLQGRDAELYPLPLPRALYSPDPRKAKTVAEIAGNIMALQNETTLADETEKPADTKEV
jgi:hypothetical protein